MGDAWTKEATPAIILSDLNAIGIWPYNRHIFNEDMFLPAEVTDGPLTDPANIAGPLQKL